MSSSRPVPLWLVLLAIPYWGAVAWLTDASLFQPVPRAEPTPVVVPAPPPPRQWRPQHCFRSDRSELTDPFNCRRVYLPPQLPNHVGDFPARPHFQTLGLARGSYETQLLLDRGDRNGLVDPFGR
jgi:hypothetical protein